MRRQAYLVTGKGRHKSVSTLAFMGGEFSFSRGGVDTPLGQALLEFPEKFKIFLGRAHPLANELTAGAASQEGELPKLTRTCLDGRVKVAGNNPLEIPVRHLVRPIKGFPRCLVKNERLQNWCHKQTSTPRRASTASSYLSI